jgi:hypothetical protein
MTPARGGYQLRESGRVDEGHALQVEYQQLRPMVLDLLQLGGQTMMSPEIQFAAQPSCGELVLVTPGSPPTSEASSVC